MWGGRGRGRPLLSAGCTLPRAGVLMRMLPKGCLPGLTAAHAHAHVLAGSYCLFGMGEWAVAQVLCTEEVVQGGSGLGKGIGPWEGDWASGVRCWVGGLVVSPVFSGAFGAG